MVARSVAMGLKPSFVCHGAVCGGNPIEPGAVGVPAGEDREPADDRLRGVVGDETCLVRFRWIPVAVETGAGALVTDGEGGGGVRKFMEVLVLEESWLMTRS